jgi:hypothetical protein
MFGGDAWRFPFELAGEVAQQSLSLFWVVEFPDWPEQLASHAVLSALRSHRRSHQ